MNPIDKKLGLSIDRLRYLLRYESGSGLFFWKKKSHKSMSSLKPGDIAGSLDGGGYIRITIDNKRYVAHRLAWFHFYGIWPEDQIDHINGNRCDNRITNLREASAHQNSANARVRRTNMLRIKGVRKHECGKFQARIWDGERNIHLGVFNSAEEASAAYEQMAIEMFGDFARAK